MKNCKNCHFLSKEAFLPNSPAMGFSLSKNEREIVVSNTDSITGHFTLKCAKGVWDEGLSPQLNEQRAKLISETNRENFCFYFPVHEGMLFQAASELQEKQQENEQLKRSNFYTRIGLWLAGIGLIASAFASFLNSPN